MEISICETFLNGEQPGCWPGACSLVFVGKIVYPCRSFCSKSCAVLLFSVIQFYLIFLVYFGRVS